MKQYISIILLMNQNEFEHNKSITIVPEVTEANLFAVVNANTNTNANKLTYAISVYKAPN